jgi:tetratricopeptide (TPR) repeat protein
MTLMGLSIRAAVLKDLGKLDESERLSRESLAAKRRIYGPDHDETLVTENTLAQTLEQQKKYDEAITLLTHAAQASEKSVGAEHSVTLSYLGNLARNQHLAGHLDEAETLMRRVLAIRQRTSPDGQSTLSVMNNLGLLLLDRKKPAEAEPIFRAMLAGVEKSMPADHWIRGQARINIGECLFDQGKYAESEPLLIEGLEKLKQTLPPEHTRITGAKVSLAKLYDAWSKPEKAAEYRKEKP